jgi:hypothetical protein
MGFRFQARVATTPGGGAIPPVRLAGILGGVAFGAATILYALGTSFWSGQQVADLDVRKGSAFEVGGLTISHTSATAKRVGPVALDPGMNPVRLVLHAGYGRMRTGQSVAVSVTMRGPDGDALWTETRRVASSTSRRSRSGGEGSHNSVLATFDVPRAGDYALEVAVNASAGAPLRRLGLEVRREVANVNPAIVWTGIAAALASLLIGFIGGRARRDRFESEQLAA